MGGTQDSKNIAARTRQMFGRQVIKTDATEITADNVLDVLQKALDVHAQNRSEIQYLWDYYKGNQPVLSRKKDVRPEICNKVVENRANEIVSFKVGYLCGEPIQYVGRSTDKSVTKQIARLNELMFAEDKASQDQELVEWDMICGTAYRMVLPDTPAEADDAPFEMFTLDPRDSFVVYSNEIGHRSMLGVKCAYKDNGTARYSVYSATWYWLIENGQILESKPNPLGVVPIFEYPANNARLGAFETVLPLLDEMNNITSNRMDGVEQFIQAFWKFVGCKLDKDEFEAFLQQGAIMVPPNDTGGNIDVDLIVKELNQQQTQTLKDDCYNAILTICGMPNRNGGTSTSDTGAAVLLRDGWSLAEARAKDSEHIFKRAEKKMLALVLKICRQCTDDITLRLADIDMKFTRRNYEAIQSKAQVLDTMLKNEHIHPLLAFEHCGMFTDPEGAYLLSEKYYQEQLKAAAKASGGETPEGDKDKTPEARPESGQPAA